ncbi:MAG: 4Fe-4S binding protein [Elusimicrobia bacterium]|nr:4Fe-4S binding protein [Elusimicrobiota bacterium]
MTEKDDRKLPKKEDLGKDPEEPAAEEKRIHPGEFSAARSWVASLVIAAASAAAIFFLTFDVSSPANAGWPQWTWAAFTSGIAFLIMKTGRVSRWRAVFFAVMAWGFVVRFKADLLGLKGSAFVTDAAQEVPYCHIALSSSILNSVYNQYLAVKSGAWREWGPLSLGFLWLAVTLALGQAWCSWVCWFGGLDDGFSRLLGKFRLRKLSLPPGLRDLPAGVLIFFVVVSMTSLKPEFCLWACPLKLTTGFLDPVDAVRKAQLAIFATIAVATLLLGPLILGKRVFCGLVCPFSAWQSLFGRINPFRVTVDAGRCTKCRACSWSCPTFSIELPPPSGTAAAALPRILPYCNRCGECVDVCPTGAISYTVLDRVPARTLFILTALALGAAVGGLFVPDALRMTVAALTGGGR